MALHELVKLVRSKRRLGRGISKSGSKSGRGMKGQRARAGSHIRAGFEGGQTPLYQRLPKSRGAKQIFLSQVKKPVAISVSKLRGFEDGSIVGTGALKKAHLISGRDKVKIIDGGGLNKKLTVRVHGVTEGARKTIEASGGKVEVIQ